MNENQALPPLPQILRVPHAALSRAAPPVQRLDDPEVLQTIALLERLLTSENMLSVSAPMIGRSVRVFVLSPKLTGGEAPVVFVNPLIVSAGRGEHRQIETCLSVLKPVSVKRRTKVRVQARNARGELFSVDAGDAPVELALTNGERVGFYARVLQHEIDHLNGITTLRRRG
jgi:peptide deformylase